MYRKSLSIMFICHCQFFDTYLQQHASIYLRSLLRMKFYMQPFIVTALTILFTLCLPGISFAQTPAKFSSELIHSIYTDTVTLPGVGAGVQTNAFPNVTSLLLTSANTTTKNVNVVSAKKTKTTKDNKSGVSVTLPVKPVFILEKQVVDTSNPSFGYLYDIRIKGATPSTGMAFVSAGVFGLLGWDSLQYGAETTLQEAVLQNKFNLPTTLLPDLKYKKEMMYLNGYEVVHSFLEYRGAPIMGMYAGAQDYDDVLIGVVSIYAVSSMLPAEERGQLMTSAQAQEFLVTALDKSKVNQKQAKKYFKLD